MRPCLKAVSKAAAVSFSFDRSRARLPGEGKSASAPVQEEKPHTPDTIIANDLWMIQYGLLAKLVLAVSITTKTFSRALMLIVWPTF